jgi:hypothetical protein
VLFGRAILPLTPIWEPEKAIVLAYRLVADRLRREEGCEDLPVDEALRHFDWLNHQSLSREIRRFVSDAGLSRDLREMKDWEVCDLVRVAIKTRAVVCLRKSDKAGKPVDATTEQRHLVRNIDKQTRGHLNFSGRQYKLVVDVDLGKVSGRNSYEVARRDEALRVLDGLAKEAGTAGDLGALLVQASAKLTPDWRPPSQPDGLILLRRIRQSNAPVKDTGPAITPSQVKALLERAWIGIVVVDNFGRPWHGDVQLRLASGEDRACSTDDNGEIHLDRIRPGAVEAVLPKLDHDAYQKA